MKILQREAELKDIVQLVGADALPDAERVVLEIGRMIREDFLRQSAYDEIDTYTSLKKQSIMLGDDTALQEAASQAVKMEVKRGQDSEAEGQGRDSQDEGSEGAGHREGERRR